jgi:hypothetical protein
MLLVLLTVTLSFTQTSVATQPPIEVVSECRSHLIDKTCDDSEDIAKVKAMNEVKQNFEQIERDRVLATTALCGITMSEVEAACNVEMFTTREREINEILNSFNVENQRKDQIYIASDNPGSESTTASIRQIIQRLESISSRLKERSDELYDLKGECEDKRTASNEQCVRPVVEVDDISPVERTEGNALAAARLSENVTVMVGQVSAGNQDLTLRNQRQATVLYREVTDVSNRTLDLADASSDQIRETVIRLRELVVCDNCTPTTPDSEPTPNPEPVARPQPRPTSIVDSDTGGGGGSTPGVSGADLVAQANSGAYGAGSIGADASNTGGQGGGLINALGSLGGMFGKTGGGFGSEGYRPSANSRASNQPNSNSRSNPGYDLPSENVDYTLNGNSNARTNPTQQARAFSGNPSSGGSGFNGSSGGAGQGLNASGGNGASGSSGSGGSKPGLLSRLFGKKKDKTMFGKAENSGVGGRFASKAKGSGSQTLNPNESNLDSNYNNQGRVFDASKYAPSAKAQARAHARATGRKIASHGLPGSFEWPSDISKNKKENIFKKVNLPHRITLFSK